MPTDALRTFRDVMLETEAYGFDKVMAEQQERHEGACRLRSRRDLRCAEGFQAPGVVVSYTGDPEVKTVPSSPLPVCRSPVACRCRWTRATFLDLPRAVRPR